jgi:hypothetical protein
MSHCRWVASFALGCSLLQVPAASQRVPDARLQHLYRLDLPTRQPAEKHISQTTPNLALHVFLDREGARLVYVGDEGKALAVAKAREAGADQGNKAPQPLYRLLLPVRGWDDKPFGKDTPRVSVEVYRDENNGNLIYVSHARSLAVVTGVKAPGKAAPEPRWLDRLRLKVRPAGEFNPLKLRQCNVEVYRDEHTGCLVYAADNGSLAVVAQEKTGAGKQTADPKWSHAMDFRVRAFGEDSFTGRTATVSPEVYLDTPRGCWLYITDALRLAVVPGGKKIDPAKVKAPVWEGLVAPSDAAAGRWSSERFRDPNTGAVLLVTVHGALAGVPGPPALKP